MLFIARHGWVTLGEQNTNGLPSNGIANLQEVIPLNYTDKQIACVDCGSTFIFTADEQAFFAEKGYANEPKRCLNCRRQKRSDKNDSSAAPRKMYDVVCNDCGQSCKVPFEPRLGKPVLCSDCYASKNR